MSGHSKWSTIKNKKGKADAARSNLFSKLSKAIMVSARSGGGDLDTNFSLRLAIEKARKASMPKDNIERAVKSGTGELKGQQIEEGIYEGYGPSGVAILVTVLTDNKNRTLPAVKSIFSKAGGSLGSTGSVQWMFERKGQAVILKTELENKEMDKDDFELEMIEAGADDIDFGDDEIIIQTKIEDLKNILEKLKEINLELEDSGLVWEAKEKVAVDDSVREKISKLFDKLEDNDDVEDYFTNAD